MSFEKKQNSAKQAGKTRKWDTLQKVVEDFDLEPVVQVGAANGLQAYRLAVMHTSQLQLLPG